MKNILLFKKITSYLLWSFALLFLLVSEKGFGQTNPAAQSLSSDRTVWTSESNKSSQILITAEPACESIIGNVVWDFATASPSTNITNVSVGDISQGNNNGTTPLITSTSASSTYPGSSGSNNAGAAAFTGILNTATSTYFTFTVTPSTGYNFILEGISFGTRRTNSGPVSYVLRSNADGYVSNIASGTISNNSSWNLKTNTGLTFTGSGNATPVIFRLYGFDGTGTTSVGTANWRIDDLTLNLTVSNTPSIATVGPSQSICGLTSTTLGGNTPVLGVGTWSQVSGPGSSTFSEINSGLSTATASFIGNYVYRWTISNGCSTTFFADVMVNYNDYSTNTTTISACDTYTWTAGNGTTYTESGIYNFTNGCVTEILDLTINTIAILTQQPSNALICKSIGSSTTFSVVTNSPTATYQWYSQLAIENPSTGIWTPVSNGDNYAGVTSSTLSITKTEPTIPETGTKYRVIVTSNCGNITSNYATITDITLPTTPAALVLTNDNAILPATPLTPVSAVAIYVGTDTEFRLTATAVSNVTYKWTLPVGVTSTSTNNSTGLTITTGNTIFVKFSASSSTTPLIIYVETINTFGCNSFPKATVPLTRLLPTAPVLNMTNGVSTTPITTFGPYMGTNTVFKLSATAAVSTTSYEWELPSGVNRVTDLVGGTITTNTSSIEPFIYINFSGVTNLNTDSYTTSTGTLTHVLRIGVKSKNGVGVSITNNSTLENPVTSSTAKLLTLIAVIPFPPSTLILNNGVTLTAVAVISNLIGQQGTYRLSASVSPLSSSYQWELPAGVMRMTALNGGTIDASTTSNDPFIYVKFTDNVTTPYLQFGVKAVNGIGSSINNNSGLLPSTTSTAKLLRLTTTIPTAPLTLTLNNGVTTTAITVVSKLIDQQGTYRLSATASSLANSYLWELPTGVTRVTALDGLINDASTTSINPFIYVKFTNVVSPGYMQFGIKAVNGVGNSITNNSKLVPSTSSTSKLLRLTVAVPLAPTTIILTDTSSVTPNIAVTVVSKYIGRATTLKLTSAVSALANTYSWELPTGVTRTDINGVPVSGFTSSEPFIYVNFFDVAVSGSSTITLVFGVKAVNSVGSSITINPPPFDTNTAKLLKVTAGLPSVVATVSGATSVCNRIEGYDYVITPPVGANYYLITAPIGSVVTSASLLTNTSNVLTTADLNFNIKYSGTTAFLVTDKNLTIKSENVFGLSSTAKIIALTKITCPVTATKIEVVSTKELKVKAYPNPYLSVFELNFNTTNKSQIEIKVYDMNGKLVEEKEYNSTEMNIQELGSNYPSGIYNVIVTQGENFKTLRVIKK